MRFLGDTWRMSEEQKLDETELHEELWSLQ